MNKYWACTTTSLTYMKTYIVFVLYSGTQLFLHYIFTGMCCSTYRHNLYKMLLSFLNSALRIVKHWNRHRDLIHIEMAHLCWRTWFRVNSVEEIQKIQWSKLCEAHGERNRFYSYTPINYKFHPSIIHIHPVSSLCRIINSNKHRDDDDGDDEAGLQKMDIHCIVITSGRGSASLSLWE